MKNNILIVDDHEIFRNGVRQLLEKETDIEVIGEAEDGVEAIEKANLLKPNIVLMDISMPNLSGIEAAKNILAAHQDIKVLLLSLYDKKEYVLKAIKMGAHGYILKDEPNKVFLKAIRKVSSGDFYYSGDISHVIIQNLTSLGSSSNVKEEEVKYHLSKREVQILTEIASGNSNKVISENFGVSIRTIESHRQNIMRKLRASNIEDAISRAKLEDIIS